MQPELAPVIFTLALFVFGGLATYTISERRHRHRWARLARRADATMPRMDLRRRAPRHIRRTALWSIYMGQMALPGGFMGLVGVAFGGIGLVSIPGMILAIRIWRLGYAMLRRDPGAAEEARKLRRFAIILNVATVAVALVMMLLAPSLAGLSLFLGVYALVSFAHASSMGACARVLEQAAASEREQASAPPATRVANAHATA